MDHDHSKLDALPTTEGGHGGHGHHDPHVPHFLNDMDRGDEEKLLEMLHVPILHGGVKEILLLSSLETDSPLSFALACILLVVFVTILELLRLLLWWVESKYSGSATMMGASCGCKQCNSLTACIGDRKQYDTIHDSQSLSTRENASNMTGGSQSKAGGWLYWVGVGFLQFFIYLISTFLMLIAMTMNIHLIISMAFGSMFGKMAVLCAKKTILEAQRK